MKLASAIKLLSQYGEVKQDKTGAKIKIDLRKWIALY